jgi:hypothetical protein
MFSVAAKWDEQLGGELGKREAGSGKWGVAAMEAAAAAIRRGAVFIKQSYGVRAQTKGRFSATLTSRRLEGIPT